MFAYASRTGTRRNLDALKKAQWGLMVSAKGRWRTEGFERYCIDNGAWWAFNQSQTFDSAAFVSVYSALGNGADFVVLPDIVCGGQMSLKFSLEWRSCLEIRCPQLLAVQDGMTPNDVAGLVGPKLGLFVGGSTEWKESTLWQWAALARERQAYLHVGRVNTARRIFLCSAVGADSFDGSSASRYADTLPLLDNSRKQLALL